MRNAWNSIVNLLIVAAFVFLGYSFYEKEQSFQTQTQRFEAQQELLQCELENLENIKEHQDSFIMELINYHEEPFVPNFKINSLPGEIYTYMKHKLVSPMSSFALAAHESSNWSSPFWKRSNNMFCMGLSSRPRDFKVHNKGDGDYKSGWYDWKSSIDDMAMWEQDKIERGLIDTTNAITYIKSLPRTKYATDPKHCIKVLSHFEKRFEKKDLAEIIEKYRPFSILAYDEPQSTKTRTASYNL